MALYTRQRIREFGGAIGYNEAILDAIKQELLDTYGLVTMPAEPSTSMVTAMGSELISSNDKLNVAIQEGYKAIIEAAEE